MGIPTMMITLLVQSDFWVSISALALEYLFAEGWVGPAITMIVNTVTPQNKGFAVSAFLFTATAAGSLSNFLLGTLLDRYDAKSNPALYGHFLCGFVVFSYLGSLPFFWLAGKHYKIFKEREARSTASTDSIELM